MSKTQRIAVVTGATGFIGRALVKTLRDQNWKVRALGRRRTGGEHLIGLDNRCNFLQFDLITSEENYIESILRGADVVFHLAAAGVTEVGIDSEQLMTANFEGTRRLCRSAVRTGVSRFVHIGSCFEYGKGSRISETADLNPGSMYARSKADASQLVLDNSSNFSRGAIVLRPFMVYGEGESQSRLIPYTIIKALANEEINLTAGNQTRDFINVLDLVEAILVAESTEGIEGEIFNICTGIGYSVKEVVAKVIQLIDSKSKINYGALEYRGNEGMSIVGDPAKSVEKLDWTPRIKLDDGLFRLVQSMKRTIL
jgi:nucleoside-diphosphate-sugar epimerase